MPAYFNPLQNYVPPAETLNALPPYPFEYTPPPPPSYIAPAPSLEEMYAGMQPYMQKETPNTFNYYNPAFDAALNRYRHATRALPNGMNPYDHAMNVEILANQLDQRADRAMALQKRYWNAYVDGMMLPELMGAY